MSEIKNKIETERKQKLLSKMAVRAGSLAVHSETLTRCITKLGNAIEVGLKTNNLQPAIEAYEALIKPTDEITYIMADLSTLTPLR